MFFIPVQGFRRLLSIVDGKLYIVLGDYSCFIMLPHQADSPLCKMEYYTEFVPHPSARCIFDARSGHLPLRGRLAVEKAFGKRRAEPCAGCYPSSDLAPLRQALGHLLPGRRLVR